MKSKVTDPDFLGKLTAAAYKSRLETDLASLNERESAEDDGRQSFFLNTEHVFAGDKAGEALLVVGLTAVWKDYVKEQVKAKNPNFATGICYTTLANSLNFEISKGRAKPAAIEKAFRKNPILKKYTLRFTILEDTEDELSDGAELFDKTKPTDKAGKAIVENIKKEMAVYKQTPLTEKDARMETLDRIVQMIDQWQELHPQPAGGDVAVAQQLQKLEDELRAQKANVDNKSDLLALYADIVTEFKDIQNLDWKNMSAKEALAAKKECGEVLAAVQRFEQAAGQQEFSMEMQARKKTVEQIKAKAQQQLNAVEQKLQSGEVARDSVLMSPAQFLTQAGIDLKADSEFTNLVKELEAIQSEKDKNNLTLDGRIAAAAKTMQTTQDFDAITEAIEQKMTRLRNLGAQAQKWMKDVGNAPSLIKALSPEAKERNQRKKNAIEALMQNIRKEMENIQYSKTLAAKALTTILTKAQASANTKQKTDPIKRVLNDLKQQNPGFDDQQLAAAYEQTRTDAGAHYDDAMYVLSLERNGGKIPSDEKAALVLENFDSIVEQALANRPNESIAFAFRGNTLFSSATSEFFSEVDTEMAKEALGNLEVIAQSENKSLEIDPVKEPDQNKRAENVQTLNRLLLDIFSQFSGKQAADRANPKIRQFCRDMHQKCAARNVPMDQVIDLVGSTIILRYINPLVINLGQRYADKAASRNLMLLSKILQNAANKVTEVKEDYMRPFVQTVQNLGPGFDLYVKTLLGVLTQQETADAMAVDAQIARNGSVKDKARYMDVYSGEYFKKILQNPTSPAYEVVYDFAKQEFSTENFDYLELIRKNQHRTLAAFREFLTADSPKEINVGNVFRQPFEALLSTKNLKTAPEQEITTLLADAQMDTAFENVEKAVNANVADTWSRLWLYIPNKKQETIDKFYSLI